MRPNPPPYVSPHGGIRWDAHCDPLVRLILPAPGRKKLWSLLSKTYANLLPSARPDGTPPGSRPQQSPDAPVTIAYVMSTIDRAED